MMYIYVVYILRATSFVMKKIRIGYVLKSADVGTLFSRRNSENSSHTHAITCKHPHTPHTYPLMPADALNLINHMKLHVNGKMVEDDDDDDEKKEQESAEASAD